MESPKSDRSSSAIVPKTPVSVLQEFYVKKGIVPKYDLVQIEGAIHEPTFKYRVTVGEFMATGCGQSKKKAKHSAAKAVLERMQKAQLKIQGLNSSSETNTSELSPEKSLSTTLAELDISNTEILSPYDDGIEGNPVGELQEICMNRRMQPPSYVVSLEEGQPHEKKFVILCSVGTFNESGSGKSKKLAKRQAASRMLNKIRSQPLETDNIQLPSFDDDELAQGLQKIQNSRNKNFLHYAKINLKPKEDSSLANLQELSFEDLKIKPIERLKTISEEEDFTVEYYELEEKSKNNKYNCLVHLTTMPVSVCFASNYCKEKAKEDSAFNALEYLRLMTK